MSTPRIFLAAFVALTAAQVADAVGLPTIDEALQMSQESGRPILALAGTAT